MAKYLGVPLEISNGNKIPRNGQPNIVTNPKFLGEETVSGNYKSIDNWRIQSDPVFGFLSKFAPLNEAIGGSAYPKKTNIVASIGNIGTAYIDLQAMDDTGLNPLDVFEIGKVYEVTYTIWSSSGREELMMNASGENVAINTTKGTHRYSFIAQETQLKFFRNFNESNVTATISDISVKEIAATETPTYGSPELVTNGDFPSGITGWSPDNATLSYSNNSLKIEIVSNGFGGAYQAITTEVGKRYNFEATFSSLQGVVNNLFLYAGTSTGSANNLLNKQLAPVATTASATFVATTTTTYVYVGLSFDATESVEVNNISVKEVQDNYLQVADANFKGLVKEGDIVFNTSTSTEGVVKEVIDNNVLLMSNDNFSTADEFFSVFAPNNDTRGNQILKIDDLAAFDYDLPAGVKSSFWFSGAKNSNNLSLYSIGESYEYHFTSKLLEEYIQRLDAQSATRSRLDIPLDKFRNGSSVTVINDIRIS